jgi:hypothetical protein
MKAYTVKQVLNVNRVVRCNVQNKQGPVVQILFLIILLDVGREEECSPIL